MPIIDDFKCSMKILLVFVRTRNSAVYVTSLVIPNLDTKEVGYKFQVESH